MGKSGMIKLIEIEALTIEDMCRIAQMYDADPGAQEWLAEPERTTADVIERVGEDRVYLYWLVRRLTAVVNLLPLQDEVIRRGNTMVMLWYAQHVPGANIEMLHDEIDRIEGVTWRNHHERHN